MKGPENLENPPLVLETAVLYHFFGWTVHTNIHKMNELPAIWFEFLNSILNLFVSYIYREIIIMFDSLIDNLNTDKWEEVTSKNPGKYCQLLDSVGNTWKPVVMWLWQSLRRQFLLANLCIFMYLSVSDLCFLI